MARLFQPFFRAIDANGVPMNGALLYFYVTGTSTPKDTYSNPALTAPYLNANPVAADSGGLFGPIYLAQDADYKAILKTSAGTTVATFDPLLVINTSVITTRGDIIVGNSSGADSRLALGSTNGARLTSDGTDAVWRNPNYTKQVFTSGSGTYTTPANCTAIRVRILAGGAGGGGTGGTLGPTGATGGTTSFGSVTVIGGTGGAGNTTGSAIVGQGGAGGTGGAGTASLRIAGQAGGNSSDVSTGKAEGGGSAMGLGAGRGVGAGAGASTGFAASANTGGGGGPSTSTGTTAPGAAGGGGEYAEIHILSPSATYSYAVGAGGAGGIGTGAAAATGGAGGSGIVIVEEFYF